MRGPASIWRPPGYEPGELPGCSTPQQFRYLVPAHGFEPRSLRSERKILPLDDAGSPNVAGRSPNRCPFPGCPRGSLGRNIQDQFHTSVAPSVCPRHSPSGGLLDSLTRNRVTCQAIFSPHVTLFSDERGKQGDEDRESGANPKNRIIAHIRTAMCARGKSRCQRASPARNWDLAVSKSMPGE